MIHRPIRPSATPETRKQRVNLKEAMRVMAYPVSGVDEVSGWVRTLGEVGMFVECNKPLRVENRCRFALTIKGENNPVMIDGWVVSVAPDGMAVQFDVLEPHLREIIHRVMDRQSAPQPG